MMTLSTLIFLPLLFALIIMIWPNLKTLRPLALGFAVIEFVLSLTLLASFNLDSADLQFVEKYSWISRFGIQYFLGVDGISLGLLLLTTAITPLVILASWSSVSDRIKGFHAVLFVLQTALLGTFLALDAVLFYVFWEMTLIPMYFLVGIWGGPQRLYATLKFFVYTMAGSVMMLVGIIYMMYLTLEASGTMSSSLLDFYALQIPFVGGSFFSLQTLLFFAFALAFAVKAAVFPLHTWLPDAYSEAPTSASVLLAAVMAKMGTYGFIRWVIPLFPEASEYWSWLFMLLAVVGIVYGALVALVQTDMKKLIAYSSISHMGYIVLGLFTFNAYGMGGSLYQMINHGIATGALFLLIGMLQDRTGTKEISQYGGLASVSPRYSVFFFIALLSSIGVPLTNGFVGEFFILMGAYVANEGFAYVAVSGVILGAVYMLWMYKRVFYGEAQGVVRTQKISDMTLRETLVLVPFAVLIFWMGIVPNHFMNYSKKSIEHLVKNRTNYQLTIQSHQSPAASEQVGN